MHKIYMENVPGKPDHMRLSSPLRLSVKTYIPAGFEWDGSSVPRLFRAIFPKWRHPIASCCHDYRCSRAKNKADRKAADVEFKKQVAETSKKESWIGYIGVRVDAFFWHR